MSGVESTVTADKAAADAIRVAGEPLARLPADLYIPPDALRVFLETFEGPLDLLAYLIRKQNLDILDIPVHAIARQYLVYIEIMQELVIDLASEYLLMAAMLAEIKSRMLLPVPATAEDEGEDPRAELVRRLAAYEQFRQAAENLDGWPRVGRDLCEVRLACAAVEPARPKPEGDLRALLRALTDVLARAEFSTGHRIAREPLSVRAYMSRILGRLGAGQEVAFTELVEIGEGRAGVVVSFLAILELVRESLIVVEQGQPYAPVALRGVAAPSVQRKRVGHG